MPRVADTPWFMGHLGSRRWDHLQAYTAWKEMDDSVPSNQLSYFSIYLLFHPRYLFHLFGCCYWGLKLLATTSELTQSLQSCSQQGVGGCVTVTASIRPATRPQHGSTHICYKKHCDHDPPRNRSQMAPGDRN